MSFIIGKMVKDSKSTISDEVLLAFAMSLLRYDREHLSEFLQMRELYVLYEFLCLGAWMEECILIEWTIEWMRVI